MTHVLLYWVDRGLYNSIPCIILVNDNNELSETTPHIYVFIKFYVKMTVLF